MYLHVQQHTCMCASMTWTHGQTRSHETPKHDPNINTTIIHYYTQKQTGPTPCFAPHHPELAFFPTQACIYSEWSQAGAHPLNKDRQHPFNKDTHFQSHISMPKCCHPFSKGCRLHMEKHQKLHYFFQHSFMVGISFEQGLQLNPLKPFNKGYQKPFGKGLVAGFL